MAHGLVRATGLSPLTLRCPSVACCWRRAQRVFPHPVASPAGSVCVIPLGAGTITTIAGNGTCVSGLSASSYDGPRPATTVPLCFVNDIAYDPHRNLLFVADAGEGRQGCKRKRAGCCASAASLPYSRACRGIGMKGKGNEGTAMLC